MSESATDCDSRRTNARILLWLLRSVVAIPIAILVVIAAAPIVYRSTQFYGIPPIDQLVDPEIDGRVVMPSDENAFTFYRCATQLLPSDSEMINVRAGIEIIDRGESWTAVPADVRNHLDECQPALAQWKLGTELDSAHYLDVADYNYSTMLPVVQDLRRFSHLATLQMSRCLAAGKTAEAWSWLKALVRSSRHVGKQGVSIERLVGIAIHEAACESILMWARHDSVTGELLEAAIRDLREANLLTLATSDTMKAEAVVASNVMTNSRDIHLLVRNNFKPAAMLRGYLFVKGEPGLSNELMRHVFANYLSQCDLPPFERDQLPGVLSLYRPTGTEVPPLMNPETLQDAVLASVLARSIVAPHCQVITACDLERSRQTALELCLLFELYRRRHGDYPETLAALVPEFIADVPVDWMGASSADKMLCVRSKLKFAPDNVPDSASAQPVTRPCLVIYGRGRVAGDGGGDLRYDNDVGLRILLPQPTSNSQN